MFLTNRSFIAQVVVTALALGGIFGIFLPVGADDVMEIIAILGFIAAQGCALIERIGDKAKAVWNRRQAGEAAQEAGALSKALARAGVR